MKFLVPSAAIVSILITSCATTESFVNDDVYSVKPSELPIGESTADETSYASFKSRKLGNTNDRMTYSDEMALRNRQNCLDQWSWYEGCGCSYTEWMRSSRHSPHNRFNSFNRMGFGYSFGSSYAFYNYGNPYYVFGGYHPHLGYWGYNDFYMYPYHSNNFGMTPYWYTGGFGQMGYNPYYGMYGMGPYGYYGSGFGGYGYGGNSNGWGYGGNNNSSSSNVIRRPRGTTASGYYNPAGRTTPSNKVKSSTFENTSPGRTPVRSGSGRDVIVKEVSGRDVIKNVPSSTNTGVSRDRISVPNTGRTTGNITPTRTTPVGTPTRSNSSDYQRTYPTRTGTTPSNSRTNGTIERSNSSSGSGFERSSSSSSERSTISSPSRSSGGMSSGSSSGSSRSGGSSGSSSSPGRR